jgi:uncharacterized protein (UPF0335 family)
MSNTLSFRSIADTMDAFDEEAKELTERRKEFWTGVREQMAARDVKALKDAIKLRRKRRADPDGEEAHDQRVLTILFEIETDGSRTARVRVAKDVPDHDPETGEIIEQNQPDGSRLGQESREGVQDWSIPVAPEATEIAPPQAAECSETAAPQSPSASDPLPVIPLAGGEGEAGQTILRGPASPPIIDEEEDIPDYLKRVA